VPSGGADAGRMTGAAPEISLGQLVRWNGRMLRVVGFDPMSIPDRRVELEDVNGGKTIRVRLDELGSRGRHSAAA
jgi:hypothetical protein